MRFETNQNFLGPIILCTMQALLRNLRFGMRMLGKSPAHTFAIVATLALGIGVNIANFTAASALLLRPFPYRDPEQLVSVATKDKTMDRETTLIRYETVRDFNQSFESVAVWTNDNLNLTGSGEPLQVPVARVSPSFFTMLGVKPQLGRFFTEDEGRPEGNAVVMLSDPMWRNRFQRDRNVIGKMVLLDGTPNIIVGVLPSNIQFPFVGPADIWTPRYFEFSLMTPQRLRTGVGFLEMAARLRPGTTLDSANADLALLNQRYREQNPSVPDADPSVVMTAGRLRDLVVGNLRDKILMLTGAVAVVLLVVCANVASLLLSRSLARKKEIAVRIALGASRSMLVQQLLTESMLLAFFSGAIGLALSWGATRALITWGATQIPHGIPIGVDLRVLLFTVVISLFAGFMFGIVPALHFARANPNTTLREEGRGISYGRKRMQMKNLLVISQMALSLLLFIGSGLLLHSFVRLLNTDPGFDAKNLLTLNVSLPTTRYAKPEQQVAFFDDVLRRVCSLPGVRSAATSAALPLSWVRITPVLAEGHPIVPLSQRPFIDIEAISPDWFRTMRVPMRAGRDFTAADDAESPKVVIANETFARNFWPQQNSLSKHIMIGRGPKPAEVIGIAADVKNKGLEQDTQPQLYLPFAQLPWGDMNLIVRTAVTPQNIISAVRAQIAEVDPDQPVTNIRTVEEILDGSRSQPRFTMLLVGVFSMVALTLAMIGIYGVLSCSVAQRRQEFGIRLALGAEHADILRLVLSEGIALAVAGIAIGLMAAILLTRLMSSMLYRVETLDRTTFFLTPLLLLSVALLASYLPARRATKVEPIEALR